MNDDEKQAERWDRFAAGYDKTVKHFDRSYPRVRELLRSDLAGREHVLEVAAGTGQFTFDIAAVAEQVTATDLSAEMVRHLRAKVEASGADNVATAVMSAYQLDLEDESIDGLFCANALHVMDAPERALSEFRRVLRPGGRLVIPTYCHGETWRARLLSWLMTRLSSFAVYTKFTATSLRTIVSNAGFETRAPQLLPGKFPLAYLVAERTA